MLKKEFWFVIVLLLAVSFLSVAAGSESQQKCYFIEAPVLFHEHEQSKVEALGALQEAQKITTVENSLQFDRALDNRLQFDAVTDNKIGDAALAEDQYRYYGHFDYTGKVGTTRAIQRIDLFQPFLRTDERLMFFDVRIGNDSHKNYEYNLGLGFREMASSRLINGFYAYLDGKRSPNRNLFHNITTGYELLFSAFEARINAYIPIGRRSYKLKEITHTHNNLIENKLTHKVINNNIYEKSFGGFDIEIGGAVPYLPQANLYATYYRFMASGMDAIDGVRVRGTWEINKYFSMEASADFGKKNNHAKYIGFKITIPFGEPVEKPSALERKMVSLPTRDIDIPSAEGQNSEVISHEIKTIGELDDLGVTLVSEELQNHEQFSGNLIFYAGDDDDIHVLRIRNLLGNNPKIKEEQFKYIHFHKKNAGKKLVSKHSIDKLIEHGHDSEDSILDQTSSPLSYDSFSNSSSSTSYSSQREGKSTSKIKKAHRLASLFSRNKETIETSTPLLEDPIKPVSSSSSNTNSSSDMSDFSSSYSSESDDISTSREDLNEYFSGSLSSSSIDVKTQTDLEDQAHQDKIKALEGDRDNKVKEDLAAEKTQSDQLGERIQEKENTIQEKQTTAEQATAQIKRLEEENNQQRQQITQLTNTTAESQADLLAEQQASKTAEDNLQAKIQEFNKRREELTQRAEETEESLRAKTAEAQRLQQELVETKQRLTNTKIRNTKNIKRLRRDRANKNRVFTQTKNQLKQANNKLKTTTETLQAQMDSNETLRTNANNQQTENQRLQLELEQAREKFDFLESLDGVAELFQEKNVREFATQTEEEMAITTKMGSKESLDRIRVTDRTGKKTIIITRDSTIEKYRVTSENLMTNSLILDESSIRAVEEKYLKLNLEQQDEFLGEVYSYLMNADPNNITAQQTTFLSKPRVLALPATNIQQWTQDNGKEGDINFGYDSNSKEIYYKGIRVFFRDNEQTRRYKYVGNLGDSSPFSSEQKEAIEEISRKKHENQIQDVQNALQELAHSVTLIAVENRHTTEAKKTRDGDKHHYIAGDLAISEKARNNGQDLKNALNKAISRTESMPNLSRPEASTKIQVSSTTSPSIAKTSEISGSHSIVNLAGQSAGDSTAVSSPSVSGSSTRTSSQNSLLTTGLTSTLPPAAPLSDNKINTESNPQLLKAQTLPAVSLNPTDKAGGFNRNILGTQSVIQPQTPPVSYSQENITLKESNRGKSQGGNNVLTHNGMEVFKAHSKINKFNKLIRKGERYQVSEKYDQYRQLQKFAKDKKLKYQKLTVAQANSLYCSFLASKPKQYVSSG